MAREFEIRNTARVGRAEAAISGVKHL